MTTTDPETVQTKVVDLSEALTSWSSVVIAIGLIIFGPFAVVATAQLIPGFDPTTSAVSWIYRACGMWTFFIMAFCLGYWVSYLVICGGIGLFAIVTIPNPRVAPRIKVLLSLVALAVGIFVFGPYQPAVSAGDGYEMMVPTQPTLPLRGLKRAQAIGEIKPCVYELLGWQKETLYYTATCGQAKRVWQINPDETSRPILFEGAELPNLSGEYVEHTEVLDRFQSHGVYPKSAEYSVRDLAIRGKAVFTPDGEWLAVVSRHIYGAEDVLLVRADKGNG